MKQAFLFEYAGSYCLTDEKGEKLLEEGESESFYSFLHRCGCFCGENGYEVELEDRFLLDYPPLMDGWHLIPYREFGNEPEEDFLHYIRPDQPEHGMILSRFPKDGETTYSLYFTNGERRNEQEFESEQELLDALHQKVKQEKLRNLL